MRLDSDGPLNDDQEFIELLLQIQDRMESPEDEQTRNYINYRQGAKISSLAAEVVPNRNYIAGSMDVATRDPNKVHIDLVYNMLLNPQQRLTLVILKKTNKEKI